MLTSPGHGSLARCATPAMTCTPPTSNATWTGSKTSRLLALATTEGRVMITFDVKDFTVIARRSAEAGQRHAGLGIVVGVDHGAFGSILSMLSRELTAQPQPSDWDNLTLFIARSTE
jgi:hypothetical protein